MKKPITAKEQYLINVPQGRAARLINRVNYLNIQGLFSDGFSSCSLIVILGAERLSLMHASHMLMYEPEVILHELQWVKKTDPECRITIFHHEGGAAFATVFSKAFEGEHCTLQYVGDEMIGITVSFTKGVEQRCTMVRPDNLLCHPQEQRFLAVHKMEQFLLLGNQQVVSKQRLIFDARYWRPVPEEELTPTCVTEDARNILGSIKPGVAMVDVGVALYHHLSTLMGKNPNIVMMERVDEFCLQNAKYFCEYANKFDHLQLFYINMTDTVTSRAHLARVNEDKILLGSLKIALKNKKTAFVTCEKLIEQCKPDTEFKKNLCSEFKLHQGRYHGHQSYIRLAEYYKKTHQDALGLAKKGLQAFRSDDLIGAIKLYRHSLLLLSKSGYCNDMNMVTVNYCLGRCLFKNGEYAQAIEFLETALALRHHYHQQDQKGLQKVLDAHQECKQQLEALAQDSALGL